jgi:hypothetical protein
MGDMSVPQDSLMPAGQGRAGRAEAMACGRETLSGC